MLRAATTLLRSRVSRPNAARRARRSRDFQLEAMEPRRLLTVPTLYANGAHDVEGMTGSNTMTFTVTLVTGAATVPVSVDYSETDGSAKAGVDYVPTTGTITFAPGQTSQTINVTTLADLAAPTNLTFSLNLANPVNGSLAVSKVTGTITENNKPVATTLSIAGAATTRGLSGTKEMTFALTLTNAQAVPVTVTATTSNISAVAGVAYQATTQVVTFAPGQKTAYFNVLIYGTSTLVPQQAFLVTLSGSSVPLNGTTGFGILSYGA
jgi:hypothetical protein